MKLHKNEVNLATLDKKIDGLVTLVDNLAGSTANGFERLEKRMDGFEKRMDRFEEKLEALTQTVNNLANKLGHYIDLHEERYLDLKHRYKLLANWAEKVASKTGIPFEFKEV